jgi:hypothetical protein
MSVVIVGLDAAPVIRSEECSGYVERLVRERRGHGPREALFPGPSGLANGFRKSVNRQ